MVQLGRKKTLISFANSKTLILDIIDDDLRVVLDFLEDGPVELHVVLKIQIWVLIDSVRSVLDVFEEQREELVLTTRRSILGLYRRGRTGTVT